MNIVKASNEEFIECINDPFSFECTGCKGKSASEVTICSVCKEDQNTKFIVVKSENIGMFDSRNICYIKANRGIFNKYGSMLYQYYDSQLWQTSESDPLKILQTRSIIWVVMISLAIIYPILLFIFLKRFKKDRWSRPKQFFLFLNIPIVCIVLNIYLYFILINFDPSLDEYFVECDINNESNRSEILLNMQDGIELKYGIGSTVVFGDQFDCKTAVKVEDYLD